jgi:peptidoglycan L-alanyl-D-glutamate endopeptidase CwlK
MIHHKDRLEGCHEDLIRLLECVGKDHEISIICGFRNKEDQDADYASGASKAKWPKSEHNTIPSIAADVFPCPLDWNDIDAFLELRNWFEICGNLMGIKTHPLIEFRNRKGQLVRDYNHFAIIKEEV